MIEKLVEALTLSSKINEIYALYLVNNHKAVMNFIRAYKDDLSYREVYLLTALLDNTESVTMEIQPPLQKLQPLITEDLKEAFASPEVAK